MRTLHELYRAFRADHPAHPASWALYMARAEIATDAVLTERFDATTYGIYDVDIDALAQHSDITLFAGSSVVVSIEDDYDARPEDDEFYSDADLRAWSRGRWRHVGVTVTVTLPDGRVGDCTLWNVEVGEYWPGSVEGQLWDPVLELTKDAKVCAEAQTAKPAVVAQIVESLSRHSEATTYTAPDGSAVIVARTWLVRVNADGTATSAGLTNWTS